MKIDATVQSQLNRMLAHGSQNCTIGAFTLIELKELY